MIMKVSVVVRIVAVDIIIGESKNFILSETVDKFQVVVTKSNLDGLSYVRKIINETKIERDSIDI